MFNLKKVIQRKQSFFNRAFVKTFDLHFRAFFINWYVFFAAGGVFTSFEGILVFFILKN